MKYRLLLFAAVIFLSSCMKEVDLSGPAPGNDDMYAGIPEESVNKGMVRIKLSPGSEVADEINIVKTKSGGAETGIPELDAIAVQLGATHIERTFPYGGIYEPRMRNAGLHLWYDIYFDESVPVTKAAADFGGVDFVETVELSLKISRIGSSRVLQPIPGATKAEETSAGRVPAVRGREVPFDDAELPNQWHYNNPGTLSKSVEGCDINLFKAWEITTGHRDVIVAVVDGGIDYNHVDLRDNFWINEAERDGSTGVDDDGNGFMDDIYGWNFVNNTKNVTADDHGTHVAGTVSAVNNNNTGVCGVAGGDGSGNGVRVMSCQIFEGRSAANDTNTKRALMYGANNGAVISQNSWGYDVEMNNVPQSDKEGIDYFIKYAGTDPNDPSGNTQHPSSPMKGGIVMFAAGNEYKNEKKMQPGAYEATFSVACVTPDFKRAAYSNVASWVKITAPGGDDPYGGYPLNHGVLSTLPGNTYDYYAGTSMACPHVSGVAALAVARFGVGRQGFTNEQLWDILIDAGDPVLYNYNTSLSGKLGSGLIDAYKAVTGGLPEDHTPPAQVNDLVLRAGSDEIEVTWSVTADQEDVKAFRYDILYSHESLGNNPDFDNPPPGSTLESVMVGSLAVGAPMTHTITGLAEQTRYYIAISGLDRSMNRAAATSESAVTLENTPPAPVADLSAQWGIDRAELAWSVTADREDVKASSYEILYAKQSLQGVDFDNPPAWSVKKTVQVGNTAVGAPMSLLIEGIDEQTRYWVAISGLDRKGSRSTSAMIDGSTRANMAPVVTKQLIDVTLSSRGASTRITLADHFSDDMDAVLTYSGASSDANAISATIFEGVLTVTAKSYGIVTVSVTATDSRGLSTTETFRAMVRDSSQTVELYPNPVKDILNIRMAADVTAEVGVQVYNSTGTKVLDGKAAIAPYTPGQVDMKGISAGSYTVVINHDGTEVRRSIVKL